MHTQAIETPVGILKSRNALYLDEVKHYFQPPTLLFKGALNSTYSIDKSFPAYTIEFVQPIFFNCLELDRYKREKYLSSSFDLVVDSELCKDLLAEHTHNHYVLATYDYVYEIVATNYSMHTDRS